MTIISRNSAQIIFASYLWHAIIDSAMRDLLGIDVTCFAYMETTGSWFLVLGSCISNESAFARMGCISIIVLSFVVSLFDFYKYSIDSKL